MTLRHSTQVEVADWLDLGAQEWMRTVGFGPAGLPAYARLRFLPDPVRPGQSECDAEVPDDHPGEMQQLRAAVDVLARWTTTPDDAWFCLWDGWPLTSDPAPGRPQLSAFGPEVLDGPMVTGYARGYHLFRGPLRDLGEWGAAEGPFGSLCPYPPAFVWPADRAWCVAADVDPHWAGIGGPRSVVDALLRAPGLDVVAARRDERPPWYG